MVYAFGLLSGICLILAGVVINGLCEVYKDEQP